MKQFTGLLLLIGTSAMTAGCASESQVLTVKKPFNSESDPFQTDGDPFQAAAATSQADRPPQPETPGRKSAPGHAVVNGASQPAVPGGSKPGWSTTRHASPTGPGSSMPPQPWQTAAVPQDNVQLTFRAASSLSESQTEVMNTAATPDNERSIPAIGSSASRETVVPGGESGDPFQQGSVTNADFIETEDANITQLGAEQPSPASPATLEAPVFPDDEEAADPFSETASPPAEEPEWWKQ